MQTATVVRPSAKPVTNRAKATAKLAALQAAETKAASPAKPQAPKAAPVTLDALAALLPDTDPALLAALLTAHNVPVSLPIAPTTAPAAHKPTVKTPVDAKATGTVTTSAETRETYAYTLSGLIGMTTGQLGDIIQREYGRTVKRTGLGKWQRIQLILTGKCAKDGKSARAAYKPDTLKAQCAEKGFTGFKSASVKVLAHMLDNNGVKPTKPAIADRVHRDGTVAKLRQLATIHNVKGRSKMSADEVLDALLAIDSADLTAYLEANYAG